MIAHHALVLLAMMLLRADRHVAHSRKQRQLVTASIAQELAMGRLGALRLAELDLWQLRLRSLITGLIIGELG